MQRFLVLTFENEADALHWDALAQIDLARALAAVIVIEPDENRDRLWRQTIWAPPRLATWGPPPPVEEVEEHTLRLARIAQAVTPPGGMPPPAWTEPTAELARQRLDGERVATVRAQVAYPPPAWPV